MPTWCFRTADSTPGAALGQEWFWQIDSEETPIAILSSRNFATLEECIAHAREHGFRGEPVRRFGAGDAEQPAQIIRPCEEPRIANGRGLHCAVGGMPDLARHIVEHWIRRQLARESVLESEIGEIDETLVGNGGWAFDLCGYSHGHSRRNTGAWKRRRPGDFRVRGAP